MILGTHNSATSGKLVWWQRPFSLLLRLTSRCQNKSIEEQLRDGVRLFNLQVCRYKGEWRISHGLCIYEEKLTDVLETLNAFNAYLGTFESFTQRRAPIIIQLYLDKNFFVGQDEEAFIKLVGEIKKKYCSPKFILQIAWIEGTDRYPHKTEYKLSIEERYWSTTWAKNYGSSWIDKLPLPKRHAKRYNKGYRTACKGEYLMLDFYDYE